MLKKHPHIGVRRFYADGPPPWLKKLWNSKFRKQNKKLLKKYGEDAVFEKKPGNIRDWY